MKKLFVLTGIIAIAISALWLATPQVAECTACNFGKECRSDYQCGSTYYCECKRAGSKGVCVVKQ